MRTKLNLQEMETISMCLAMRLKVSSVLEPDVDLTHVSELKTLIDASIQAEKERIRQNDLFDLLDSLQRKH